MLREQQLIIEMHIEGKTIDHFLSFELKQAFNAHHTFELRLEHGTLGLPGLVSLEESRDFVGRRLAISFGYDEADLQNFGGMITNISLSQSNGYQGELVITGYSPTILIDRGPDLGSYLDRNLKNIVELTTNEIASNDLYLAINPSRTAPLGYVIQYRESDFEFLNRLSADYYEWFYYDGERLFFGKPDEQRRATLTYGREITTLDYGINIAPIKQQRFFYDPKADEMLNGTGTGDASGSADLEHAVNRSNLMYSKVHNQPVVPRIDSQSDLKGFVENEQKAAIGQLLKVKGGSDSPEVRLGSEIEIRTSVRQGLSFSEDTLGSFLITQVTHNFDGLGHYTNSFEGITGGTERIPVKENKRPNPDLQLANVVDNTDPRGQGRVKVQFKWQCGCNDETEWLRVISPNAGSGDVGANRGFMAIPEVGDQVVVTFEEGNIARPIVMGSVYHGKSGDSTGFQNSDQKGLTSRKGSALTFDDLNHALNLGTNGANFVNIQNGSASIRAQAGSKVTISSGQSTITLDKEGNISINGVNISISGSSSIDIQSPKITIGNLAPAEGATEEQQAAATQTLDLKAQAFTIEGQDTFESKAPVMDIGQDDGTLNLKANEINGTGGTGINLEAPVINSN